jgi:hypothetical protein
MGMPVLPLPDKKKSGLFGIIRDGNLIDAGEATR